MTTRTEAREAIYEAWRVGWVSGGSELTPYCFDNEDFDPKGLASWARLSVRHTDSTQDTLGRSGNRKFLRSGNVLVQLFTQVDDGTRSSDELVEVVKAIFEGVSLAGTTVDFIGEVIPRETGPDGKWYQVVVEASFQYTETR